MGIQLHGDFVTPKSQGTFKFFLIIDIGRMQSRYYSLGTALLLTCGTWSETLDYSLTNKAGIKLANWHDLVKRVVISVNGFRLFSFTVLIFQFHFQFHFSDIF